jgi:hypothetical protein
MTLCQWPLCDVRLTRGTRYCSRSHASLCAFTLNQPYCRVWWLSSVTESRVVPDRWWALSDQLW